MVLLSNMGVCRLVLVAATCWGTMQGSSGVDTDPCPLKPSATCRYVGGNCLCVLDPTQWTGDFPNAEADCGHMLGASVACLHNEEGNAVLMNLIANSSTAVWLGIRGGPGGPYSWIDGTPVDYLNVVNVTQEEGDSCHIMKPEDGRWWPKPGSANYGVACTYPWEIHSTQTSETTEITSSPGHQTTTVYAPCPADCRVVNVSCICVQTTRGNWPTMDKTCAIDHESVPASIMTQEENDIIRDMIKQVPAGVWIGLGWNGNFYVWNGGKKAIYLNLENSSSHGDLYMMSSNDGKWYPADGMKGNFGVVCRYEPTDPPITHAPSTTPASTLVPSTGVPQGGPNITKVIVAVVVVLVVVATTAVLVVIFIRRRRRKRLEDYANLTSHVDI